ncbi:MAG: hypothetical protein EHM28_04735 [Spirochaetaceae bacterium]|nr:MAG: hypothetical protein EHM28_04735 [Spirochaetaceae bacterium]
MKNNIVISIIHKSWVKTVFILSVSIFLFLLWLFMIDIISGWQGLTWLGYYLPFGGTIVVLFNIAIVFLLVSHGEIKKHWIRMLIAVRHTIRSPR